MLILILGVLLWAAAHMFKRLMPERRAQMGDKGRGAVALALVVSVILMVIGYKMAAEIFVWAPPYFLRHLNNLMVLVAIYMMSPAPKKGVILNGLRHPMLLGFALWAVAHLMVNGDLASIILFGGLLSGRWRKSCSSTARKVRGQGGRKEASARMRCSLSPPSCFTA